MERNHYFRYGETTAFAVRRDETSRHRLIIWPSVHKDDPIDPRSAVISRLLLVPPALLVRDAIINVRFSIRIKSRLSSPPRAGFARAAGKIQDRGHFANRPGKRIERPRARLAGANAASLPSG